MLEEIDAFKAEFTLENDDTFVYLAECCSHAWHKVEKYFRLANEMPIVYAAVILDPRLKDKWFVENWQDKGPEERRWIVDVTAQVKELWRTDYKAVAPIYRHKWRACDPCCHLTARIQSGFAGVVVHLVPVSLKLEEVAPLFMIAILNDRHPIRALKKKSESVLWLYAILRSSKSFRSYTSAEALNYKEPLFRNGTRYLATSFARPERAWTCCSTSGRLMADALPSVDSQPRSDTNNLKSSPR